jgi:hypothetical protein
MFAHIHGQASVLSTKGALYLQVAFQGSGKRVACFVRFFA